MNYKDTANFRQGIELLHERWPEATHKFAEELYAFSPELSNVVIGHGGGEIWARDTSSLSVKEKEMAVLSSLITLSQLHEVKTHTFNCLKVGVTEQQLKHLLTLLSLYIGVPKTLEAMLAVRDGINEFNQLCK
jgi:4-carboxymuconolactone decarboxylase